MITNSGTILGTGTGLHPGVLLGTGTLVNSGIITSTSAMAIILGSGTVDNSGRISGSSWGVQFFGASNIAIPVASLVNTGLIEGSNAVEMTRYGTVAGAVTNFGTIEGTGTSGVGIFLNAGGSVTNGSSISTTALASGGLYGIQIAGTTSTAATISNTGTIVGSVGISIGAADAGNNTIVNFGTITGTSGTAVGLGTAGNDLLVIGSTNSSLQGVVANLQPGDRFDLPFLSFTGGGTATVVSDGTVSQQLQVVENAGTFTIALDPNQIFAGDVFQLSTDSGSGTLVTEQPVCFCRGTLILTEKGEVPVEDLAIGDRVRTLSGACKPIVWIGFGRDLVTRRNSLARPIVVRAGALADNVPRRDLYLTHGHALYLDGVLIPVENLVNHRSIR